jgi:hypothetical protein
MEPAHMSGTLTHNKSRAIDVKKTIIMVLLSMVALVASFMISDGMRIRIAISESLAAKIEQQVITVDARTEEKIANLVAAMRAHGPHTNPDWENRRQSTIERLENLLADATTTSSVAE